MSILLAISRYSYSRRILSSSDGGNALDCRTRYADSLILNIYTINLYGKTGVAVDLGPSADAPRD